MLVIAGPTASGKSSLAMQVAQVFPSEIIGADSIQIYRHVNIGSAKPSVYERATVPHHLIDVLDLDAPIDAATYAAMADAVIAQVQARGRLPIIVGGTGLWIRALLRGLVTLPPVDPVLRAALWKRVDEDGLASMHARLVAIDPVGASKIHPHDALRVVRALEVYEQTGTPLGDLHAQHARGMPRHAHVFLVMDPPRDWLRSRIAVRVEHMLASGWVDEVRRIIARAGPDAKPLKSVGYRQIVQWLSAREHEHGPHPTDSNLATAKDLNHSNMTQNDMTQDDMTQDDTPRAGAESGAARELSASIVQATRLYAKQQRNWFRAEPGIKYLVDPTRLAGCCVPQDPHPAHPHPLTVNTIHTDGVTPSELPAQRVAAPGESENADRQGFSLEQLLARMPWLRGAMTPMP